MGKITIRPCSKQERSCLLKSRNSSTQPTTSNPLLTENLFSEDNVFPHIINKFTPSTNTLPTSANGSQVREYFPIKPIVQSVPSGVSNRSGIMGEYSSEKYVLTG